MTFKNSVRGRGRENSAHIMKRGRGMSGKKKPADSKNGTGLEGKRRVESEEGIERRKSHLFREVVYR